MKEFAFEVHVLELAQALDWMQQAAGVYGLVVKKGNGCRVDTILFGTFPEDTEKEAIEDWLETTSELVLNEVTSWH